ncbi:MAG TPA: hypothetical protein VJX16_24645 [Terriglobales bacterium]|nr:hypothetical protein [Terriglobales bacterium]
MKVFRFLWPLSVLCVAAANSAALDRNAFTFTHYKLNVRIEPEQQRLAVRGKITLRNDSSAAQKHAVLQISSSLGWRSIQIAGKPVQFVSQTYTSDLDHTGALSEAIVSLPDEVRPNAAVDLDIGYEGIIALDTARLKRIDVPDDAARHSDWDQISPRFSAVRGVGYATWYPIATEAANLSEGNGLFEVLGEWKTREKDAVMDLAVCVQQESGSVPAIMANATAVAPGDDSCVTYKFSTFGVDVPTFVTGPYSKVGNRIVEVYYLGDNRTAAESYLRAAESTLPLVASWFGEPRGPAEVAELPDASAAPFEAGSMLLTPFSTDQKFAELTLVHELAHKAFPSSRPWIYEGLAHFAQVLWREQQAGRAAALDYVALHRSAIADAEKVQRSHATQPLVTTTGEEFYRSKAMFVWWMLRDMVGDTALKQALKTYRPEVDKDPSYTQKLIEAAAKRDLSWFFDDWVYQDKGLPDFRVASVYPRAMDTGGYVVTVSVENLGAAGAETPVTVRMQTGEATKRLEVRGKSTAAIRIEVPSMPEEVIVNDGSVPETDMSNNTFKIEPAK